MTDSLLIVFAKNPKLGKVKTRLAQSIGNEKALEIYKSLLKITEAATSGLINTDVHIYSNELMSNEYWLGKKKFLQEGNQLGEKMKNAMETAFSMGYTKVILIGSDLPDMSTELIENAVLQLDLNDVVIGPAKDGGYYLVGMTKPLSYIFENKQWSTSTVLKDTLENLIDERIYLLRELNDIDTFEDLQNSILHRQE